MDREQVVELIRSELLAVRDVDPALVTEDASLGDRLGADSVDLIEVAGVLEQRLDIAIDDHELHDLVTFGDFVTLVCSKL